METQQHYRPSDALADVQATRESVKGRGRSPFLALYLAAVVVHFDRHPQWWGLVLGAAGVGVTLLLGRVMENAWARRAAPATAQVAA